MDVSGMIDRRGRLFLSILSSVPHGNCPHSAPKHITLEDARRIAGILQIHHVQRAFHGRSRVCVKSKT